MRLGSLALGLSVMRGVGGGSGTPVLTGMRRGDPLRVFIESLRDTSVTGRQSTLPLRVPGVDTLPTGMTYTPAGVSPAKVTIGAGFTGDLTDWDFTDCRFSVDPGFVMPGKIMNCVLGGDANGTAHYPIYIDIGGSIELEYCTVASPETGKGAGTVINSNNDGNLVAPSFGIFRKARRTRFTGWRSDIIKVHGGGATPMIIEECYFGTPIGGEIYSGVATYNTGDRVVSAEGRCFSSKIDGNVGNTPPATGTSDSNWNWHDVHGDVLTFVMNVGGTIVRRCLADFGSVGGVVEPRSVGPNNILRMERNTGANFLSESILAEENVFYFYGSVPVGGGLSGGENYPGPVRILNNAIEENGSGVYFNGDVYDEWTGNIDAEDDSPITPGPVVRTTIHRVLPFRVSDTAANVRVDVASNDGTIYVVATSGATQPSEAQIKAGQDHTGAAAHEAQSVANTGTISGGLKEITLPFTALPSAADVHFHAVYERPGYSTTGYSGLFKLAETPYADRDVSQVMGYTGPNLSGGVSDITVRFRFTVPEADVSSDETLFTVGNGNFRLFLDLRDTRRQIKLTTSDSGPANALLAQSDTYELAFGAEYEVVATATQNDGTGRAQAIFLNGIKVAEATAAATGTGSFNAQAMYVLKSIFGDSSFAAGVHAFQVWEGAYVADGDISGLGAATHQIIGDAATWNQAAPAVGWTKSGAGVWTTPGAVVPPPSTPTNWWDFTDVASVTTSGGLITGVTDQQAGSNLVFASGERPAYRTDPRGYAAMRGAERATFSSPITVDKQDHTIFFVLAGGETGSVGLFSGASGNYIFGARDTLAESNAMFFSSTFHDTAAVLWPGQNAAGVVYGLSMLSGVARPAEAKLSNGVNTGTVSALSAGTSTLTYWGAWINGTNHVTANIMAALYFDTALSDVEITAMQDWAKTRYGVPVAGDTSTVIICDGDSITRGFGVSGDSPSYQSWPAQLTLHNLGGARVDNRAIDGWKVSDDTSATRTTTALSIYSGHTNRIVLFMGGSNDIFVSGNSAATVQSNIAAWIASVRAADPGAIIGGCTIIDRGTDAVRDPVNAWILASADFDFVVDLTGIAGLEDNTDTAFFNGDGIHMIEPGSKLIADAVRAQLVSEGYVPA